MSGLLNKLGLGHKDHATTDSHHDSHSHHGNTATTTTTTTANSGLNQSAIGTTAPYGSSTNTSTTRSGAAYSDSGIASTGLASQTVANQSVNQSINQGIHQTNHLSGDNAMTRSEEQLRVAKATVETGKAELNKTVEHVHVEQAVPVQRERVVIEREPVTQSNMSAAMSGPAISEAHYETTIKEDRVAATKETVPIERIRLAKQVETHVESVGADLRKEHVDLTMHGVDNSKIDHSLHSTNEKFDSTARSGLAHDNTRIHDSNIHTASNTRNI